MLIVVWALRHHRIEWFRVHRMVWPMEPYTRSVNHISAIQVTLEHFIIITVNIITYQATAIHTINIKAFIIHDHQIQVHMIRIKVFTHRIHIIIKWFVRTGISILFHDNLSYFIDFWYFGNASRIFICYWIG